MRIKISKIVSVILFLISSGLFVTSCGKKSMEGLIIITQANTNTAAINYMTGDSWRYVAQTSLMVIDPERPDKAPKLLTGSFFSARSPEISYDGKNMLFAGQKTKDDKWQIWEMNLRNLKIKQITSFMENSVDPAYLPGGRIVFSSSSLNDSLKAGHSLFTCNLDGSDPLRITFNPHTYFASSVLKDGRVLTISRQVYPVQNEPSMMVLRPDGTKSELFYSGVKGTELFSRGWETVNGKVVFIESDYGTNNGGSIVSVSYNRPLHSRANLTSSIGGNFYSAFPLPSGNLLVSFRASANERYSLYDFDPQAKMLGKQVFKNSEYDVLEAVLVTKHDRPKKLPSEVDMGVKTGLLLCQNINITGMQSPEIKDSIQHANKIEIIGIDSSLGVVNVEKDGSVYLKVAADIPFRIKTLDSDGNILQGPGSWLWIRPNERRGCVGCHEDQEIVPANRLSLAVKNQPISVPVHFAGIKEKKVELE